MSIISNKIKIVVLKNEEIMKPGVDYILEGDNLVLKTPLQPNEKLSVRKLEENNG